MIRHIVLVKFRPEIDDATIDGLFDALAALGGHIRGMIRFDGGVSISPENLEQGFRHGFCIDFTDEKARDAYLEDPGHQLLGQEVIKAAEGGISGLLVIDLRIGSASGSQYHQA